MAKRRRLTYFDDNDATPCRQPYADDEDFQR